MKPYSEEKDSLHQIAQHAGKSFKFRKELRTLILQKLASDPEGKDLEEICELLNISEGKVDGTAEKEESIHDMGQWIGEYLDDNGYNPHVNPILIKQMVMTAFPTVSKDKEITPQNLEESLLRIGSIMSHYVTIADKQKSRYSLPGILQLQPAQNFYT